MTVSGHSGPAATPGPRPRSGPRTATSTTGISRITRERTDAQGARWLETFDAGATSVQSAERRDPDGWVYDYARGPGDGNLHETLPSRTDAQDDTWQESRAADGSVIDARFVAADGTQHYFLPNGAGGFTEPTPEQWLAAGRSLEVVVTAPRDAPPTHFVDGAVKQREGAFNVLRTDYEAQRSAALAGNGRGAGWVKTQATWEEANGRTTVAAPEGARIATDGAGCVWYFDEARFVEHSSGDKLIRLSVARHTQRAGRVVGHDDARYARLPRGSTTETCTTAGSSVSDVSTYRFDGTAIGEESVAVSAGTFRACKFTDTLAVTSSEAFRRPAICAGTARARADSPSANRRTGSFRPGRRRRAASTRARSS